MRSGKPSLRQIARRGQFYLVVLHGRILYSTHDHGEARAFHAGLHIAAAELIVGRQLLPRDLRPQARAS